MACFVWYLWLQVLECHVTFLSRIKTLTTQPCLLQYLLARTRLTGACLFITVLFLIPCTTNSILVLTHTCTQLWNIVLSAFLDPRYIKDHKSTCIDSLWLYHPLSGTRFKSSLKIICVGCILGTRVRLVNHPGWFWYCIYLNNTTSKDRTKSRCFIF